jgi:hypothetical protein
MHLKKILKKELMFKIKKKNFFVFFQYIKS